MSLYPNIQDSSSEGESNEFLQEITSKIDPTDKEVLRLFGELQKDPNSVISLQSMILHLAKPKQDTQLVGKLASYLKSHVELLESIAHNPELASLFLVGENGKQTFTSIHKMIIKEQAARTRMFLSTNNLDDIQVDTNLADYQQFINNVDNLPDKLNELDETVEEALEANDIKILKAAYQELAALFSGCLVFNDVIIKNKGEAATNVKSFSKYFPSAPQDARGFRSWVQEKVSGKENALRTIEKLKEENEKLTITLQETAEKLNSKKREVRSLKSQLKDNISIIQEQKNELTQKINNLQTRMNEFTSNSSSNESMKAEIERLQQKLRKYADKTETNVSELEAENKALHDKLDILQSKLNKKDIKLTALQEVISNLKNGNDEFSTMQKQHHSELTELQKLYQSSTESLFKAKEKNKELESQLSSVREQLSSKKEENNDMRSMLSNAQSRIKEQASENEKLLKQLKKGAYSDAEVQDLRKEISLLKKKLIEANSFIAKLQRKIEEFRHKQSSTKYVSLQTKKEGSKISTESENLSSTDVSESISSESTVTPNLEDLDREIKKLERNVSISRKVLQEKNTYVMN